VSAALKSALLLVFLFRVIAIPAVLGWSSVPTCRRHVGAVRILGRTCHRAHRVCSPLAERSRRSAEVAVRHRTHFTAPSEPSSRPTQAEGARRSLVHLRC